MAAKKPTKSNTSQDNVTHIEKNQPSTDDKPKLKPVDPASNTTMAPQGQPMQGLKVMSKEDVDEYMESLLKNKVKLDGLELQALEQFTGISRGLNQAQQQLQQARQQAAQLEDHVKRTQGQLDAYANLLIAAEDTRRANK